MHRVPLLITAGASIGEARERERGFVSNPRVVYETEFAATPRDRNIHNG